MPRPEKTNNVVSEQVQHTNRVVQAQKMARGWKFRIKKVEELFYPCSENKGTDQLRSYCEADSHMQNVGFRMMRLIYIMHAIYA